MKPVYTAVAAIAILATLFGIALSEKAEVKHQDTAVQKQSPTFLDLKKLEGKWDATITAYGDDGSSAETKGTETIRLVGEWAIADFEGDALDLGTGDTQSFRGHSITGWDAVKKKYITSWVDDTMPMMMIAEGKIENGELVFYTELPDPMTGKPTGVRMMDRWTGDDSHLFEMYMTGPDGEETKTMQIAYTRK